MDVYCCSVAFLRSRTALLALALVFTSSLVIAQDSFMFHYTQSEIDATTINRGDFNNDGIPDLVVANNAGTGGYGVSVLLGIGDGRFQNALNAANGIGVYDMAVGDFNGDGNLDVALAGYVSSTQSVLQIMLGKGDGTFNKGQTINLPANQSPRSIATGDFNGDGKLDLAYVTGATTQVYFYKGSGSGTFKSAGSVSVGTNTPMAQVRVGDFDADGKMDLMVSDVTNLYVLWNTGNFNFHPVGVASSSYGVYGRPVDVNQDGFTDLVVTSFSCSNQKPSPSSSCTDWEVLLGSATRKFTQSALLSPGSEYDFATVMTAADVNGDGINDLVGLASNDLLVFLGNSDGSYQSTPLAFPNSGLVDLVAGDFNRDGKVDFAGPGPGNSASLETGVYLNATPRAACTPNTVSPSVTVCEPQDLIYSNSPVQWIADSRDTAYPVTAMQIYVDNKLVVNSPSSSLDEPLTLANGPHFVVTKAWDESGANFVSDRNITIYSGTPGETCPASTGTLNICSPAQNETTTTSLHVFANAASSGAQMTSVQVYVDNSLVYNDTSGATYVDTALTVSPGSHSVVVKAWDADGNSYSQSMVITAQ